MATKKKPVKKKRNIAPAPGTPLSKLPKVKMRMPSMYEPAGNAFVIMGFFQEAARKVRWPQSSINKVMSQATSNDYDHLRSTFLKYIKETE